jgi:hypothetical protein
VRNEEASASRPSPADAHRSRPKHAAAPVSPAASGPGRHAHAFRACPAPCAKTPHAAIRPPRLRARADRDAPAACGCSSAAWGVDGRTRDARSAAVPPGSKCLSSSPIPCSCRSGTCVMIATTSPCALGHGTASLLGADAAARARPTSLTRIARCAPGVRTIDPSSVNALIRLRLRVRLTFSARATSAIAGECPASSDATIYASASALRPPPGLPAPPLCMVISPFRPWLRT